MSKSSKSITGKFNGGRWRMLVDVEEYDFFRTPKRISLRILVRFSKQQEDMETYVSVEGVYCVNQFEDAWKDANLLQLAKAFLTELKKLPTAAILTDYLLEKLQGAEQNTFLNVLHYVSLGIAARLHQPKKKKKK